MKITAVSTLRCTQHLRKLERVTGFQSLQDALTQWPTGLLVRLAGQSLEAAGISFSTCRMLSG